MMRLFSEKTPTYLTVIFGLLPFIKLSAVDLPLETRGFVLVEGGPTIRSTYNLYASSFDDEAFSPTNPSDLVILEAFVLLEEIDQDTDTTTDDVSVFLANYEGYDLTSGSERDAGHVVLEVPSADGLQGGAFRNIGAGASVGFFRRSGSWTELPSDATSAIGSMTGTFTYTNLQPARDVVLVMNGVVDGEPFTVIGETTSTVLSTNGVLIGGFGFSSESTQQFSFAGFSLLRDETEYTGFFRRTDESEPQGWFDRVAIMKVTDVNDSDGDDVPDLSDLGAEEVLGILQPTAIRSGDGVYYSPELGSNVYVNLEEAWLFSESVGWFRTSFVGGESEGDILLPDERLGWVNFANDGIFKFERALDSKGVLIRMGPEGNYEFAIEGEKLWQALEY